MSWDETSTPEKPKSSVPAQLGTALFMIATLLVFLCYLAIFFYPQLPLNPFPPLAIEFPTATVAAMAEATPVVPPTFTPPRSFPATWTPTLTPTWTPVPPTSTPRPTWTPVPPTLTPKPLPPFSVSGNPIYTKQTLYPNASDWWTGIAGEVADRQSQPVTDATVRIWDDSGHVWEKTPGDDPRYSDVYGTKYGGKGTFAWWEQFLESSCHRSFPVHVQIYRNGKAASSVVNVKTTGDCDKNLIIVHFIKNY